MTGKKGTGADNKVINFIELLDNPEKIRSLKAAIKRRQEEKVSERQEEEGEQETCSISTDEYNLNLLAETVYEQLSVLEKTLEFLSPLVHSAGNNSEKESFQKFGRALKKAMNEFMDFWEGTE